jgi:hypothetical protein
MNHDTVDRRVSTNLEGVIRPSCELSTGRAASPERGIAAENFHSFAVKDMLSHNRLQRVGLGTGTARRGQISMVNGFSTRRTKAAIHAAATAPSITR